VGDVDASGASEAVLASTPLRARVFREALDAGDPARARTALARVSRRPRAHERIEVGLSPHAPYTVSDLLLRDLRDLASAKAWPVAVHWAETEEEVLWLARGRGPFSRLLPGTGSPVPARAEDGLAILDAARLLSPRLSLIHGNHPRRGDRERVARAGAVLVHCPGTHAYFARAPFELSKWLRAGVTVALGTDGLSSNEHLDMRREMALLRAAHPSVAPERVLEMATVAGARAIGFEGSIGRIAPRLAADLCAHRLPDGSARELADRRALLDAVTSGRTSVDAAWVAGRRVRHVFSRPPSESSVRDAE
jgi:cytosine/adenosine deaminase-related metal-dependent hydrolase